MFNMKIAHQIVGSLLLISVFLKAQTTYITDSTYFQRISFFYYIQDSSFHSYQYSYPDTSVLGFQNSLPFYFNGQIGTTQPDYLLQNMNTEIGSRVLNVYYPDEVRPTQVDIFRTKGFYSKLEGIAGSKDEQHFRAWFLSPIRSHSQINFYLRRSTNTGFYQNQKGSVTNVFADYHFFSKKKISMDAQILLNFIKHQENGGIVKDTLSYNDLLVDKILIPVNLSDAKKNYQSQFFHYQINYLLNHRHALSLGMDANKQLFHYQDNFPSSGYYSFVFIDTTKTNDSLHSWKVNLPLSYT
ncbi:MAG: putative porin, partial [Bacteroidia bacterium]|nr:putative porin [Bacteroidia bacterium]